LEEQLVHVFGAKANDSLFVVRLLKPTAMKDNKSTDLTFIAVPFMGRMIGGDYRL
jgi:hypothetical protein